MHIVYLILSFFFVDQKEKSMIPISGDNEEWDLLNQQIKDVQQQFADHLKVVQKQLR